VHIATLDENVKDLVVRKRTETHRRSHGKAIINDALIISGKSSGVQTSPRLKLPKAWVQHRRI